MPELPEVQTIVNTLSPRLVDRRIESVRLLRPDILSPPDVDLVRLLTGGTVAAVRRRGKRIVFSLYSGAAFYIHLGMTGRLTLDPPDEPLRPHTHLILRIAGVGEARFVDPRRFGGVWWLGEGANAAGTMGPEPLDVRPAQLAARLSRTRRNVKNALLDQRVLAGLGNIYVDEALFAAGIHPLTIAGTLSAEQVARLNRAIKSVLRRALRHRGSTFRDYRDADGTPGNFQKLHRVYGREGQPCANCRTAIERIVIGGRSTHFCPRCQPGNRARSSRR